MFKIIKVGDFMDMSYKFKSKLTTAIGGICTILTVLGVDQLSMMFPSFGKYIPALVALATWYSSQHTENVRVDKAVDKAQKEAVETYQKEENYNTINYDDILNFDDELTAEEIDTTQECIEEDDHA